MDGYLWVDGIATAVGKVCADAARRHPADLFERRREGREPFCKRLNVFTLNW
jgi:hypothetical protein